ncbi:TIGR03013 family XrtA/PEP-CTERM system glycosyltransferase [Terriglobus aquaticus]|uniref:TIGR03013 family XrtA/PEP-CTERM system glycosyltransferase n=1 Tax=Terriglobus aquaticus TaxID=940139 RepID=A0ABW9KHQ4_9BACT|nr:TIGR03013 family XrtA/PEP-CTERM system glycosyltransferase [Terriglobus aquaticus]
MIRFLNVYLPTRVVALLLGETIVVLGCFLLASQILLGPDMALALVYEDGWLKLAGLTLVIVLLSYYFDLYEPETVSVPFQIFFRMLLVLGFSCFVLAAAMFFWPEIAIRQNLYALGFLLLTPALMLWRRAYVWMVNLPGLRERVYVLGDGEQAQSIVELLRTRRDVGMEVLDWRPLTEEEATRRREVWGAEIKRLLAEKKPLQRIIVALEEARGQMPVDELLQARLHGVRVERVGEVKEQLIGKIQLSGLQPSTMFYGEGFRVKTGVQLTRVLVSGLVAGCILLVFLPFFPLVVLAVRLSSPGPIFFRQTRVGMGGKPFHVYKFRSMRTDAEASGAKWAVKNDPRVTPIGTFLRKTRIDEVPQLWNVLRGDMGLVGPRPERPEFVPYLAENLPFYNLRHLIRPGLTGWAQVRYGYGATLEQAREKLEYDLYYIKHMTLGLDLLVMFETIKTVVRRRGQ